MHRWSRAAFVLAMVAAIACQPDERAEPDTPPVADTVGVEDSAALVGDTLMARDTVPEENND